MKFLGVLIGITALDSKSYIKYRKNLCKTATLKISKIGFQDQLSLNAGQKYCRMLQAAFCNTLTFIKLSFIIKMFVLSIFEWLFYTGFTVLTCRRLNGSMEQNCTIITDG